MITVESQDILLESHSQLHCPFSYEESVFLACENGEIIRVTEGDVKIEFKCNGQPNGVVFDSQKSSFYVTDMANQSVLAYTSGESQTNVLVRDYEGVPLLGPHSLCLSKKTGNIFFTDSGELAETSIQHPKGSVFLIDVEQQNIRPLSLRCLAMPTGIALSEDQRLLYVCETGKNRLLRYFQSNQGIFYSKQALNLKHIFHQFTGKYGPTCVSILQSKQLLFVSLYEFRSLATEGSVAVLNYSGEQIARLAFDRLGPQINGMYIVERTGSQVTVFLTEESTGTCYRIEVDTAKKQQEKITSGAKQSYIS